MAAFCKLFPRVLAMSILLYFLSYYILPSDDIMDLLINRYRHTKQMNMEAERKVFKDTKIEQGETEEMLLVAKTNYNFSDINHSPNSNISHTVVADTNTQKSMDIFPCTFMRFEDAVMEQYKHFEAFSSQKQRCYKEANPLALYTTMKFNFTILGVQVCNQMTYRILQITETMKKGEQTEGGSGFMVRSFSHYLTVCPVIDNFNGTCSVMCPFYGSCTNVSVVLKHLQFSGFVGRTSVIEKPIWKQDNICVSPKDINLVTL